MTTYPTAAIREAMLRAGCSLAMTDAAMYHLELLAAKPEAKTITCEEAGCDTCPAQAAKEASTDQPPQPSIEERVAKLEAIVHDGELRSRVIGLETRGDKLAREVYRMGGEVKLPAPSPESPTGGERRTDWKCETGVCECPEFDCRVRRGEKCRHADCEPAPKASDQPPASVGQPGVPAGWRVAGKSSREAPLPAVTTTVRYTRHRDGTVLRDPWMRQWGAFVVVPLEDWESGCFDIMERVPVEPSRPGTGEAVEGRKLADGWRSASRRLDERCEKCRTASCDPFIDPTGARRSLCLRDGIKAGAFIAPPAPGKPVCDCTAATACAFHQPGKPDEAPLSERLLVPRNMGELRGEVAALEVQLAARTAEVESLRAERDAAERLLDRASEMLGEVDEDPDGYLDWASDFVKHRAPAPKATP